MAIAFSAVGTADSTASSGVALDPTCPATVDAGDILIAHICYRTNLTDSPSTPADWTLLYGPITVTTTTAEGRHWIYGKVAAGDEDSDAISFGSPAVTYLRMGRIYRYTGRVSGTLADCVPSAGFSNVSNETDPPGPTVTTTVAGALAVYSYFQTDDNAPVTITGMTGGTWVDRGGFSSSLGDDGTGTTGTCTPTSDPGTVSGGSGATANDQVNTIGYEIRPNAPSVSHTDSCSGTIVIAGSLSEDYSTPVVYTDRRSGTIIASGTESDSNSRTSTPSGKVVLGASQAYKQAVRADTPSFYYRMDGAGVVTEDSPTTAYIYGPDESANTRWARIWHGEGGGDDWTFDQPGALGYDSSRSMLGPARRGAFVTYPSYAEAVTGTGVHYPTYAGEWATNPPFTVELWYKRTGGAKPNASKNRDVLFDDYNPALLRGAMPWDATDPLDNFQFTVGATTTTWTDVGVGVGEWHHVALRFNPTAGAVGELAADTVELFIDGVSQGAQTNTANVGLAEGFNFGTNQSDDEWGGPYGYIDEPAFYFNAVLSAERIAAHYAAQIPGVDDLSHSSAVTGTINLTGTISESWTVTTTYTDNRSGQIDLNGTRTESSSQTAISTGTIVVSGTLGESFTPGGETFTDNRSGQIDVSGTRREDFSRTDKTYALVTISGTVSESWTVSVIYTDRRSGQIDIAGTRVESSSQTTLRTGTIVLSGAIRETYAGSTTDRRSGQIDLSGTRRESNSRTDQRTGTITVSGSASESWAKTFTDRRSGQIDLSGTRRESNSRASECSGTIVLSGAIREQYIGATTDRRSGTIVLSGTRVESNSRATRESGTIVLSGTVSESWTVSGGTQTDSVSGTIVLSGTRRESQSRSVRTTGTIIISGSASDTYGIVNSDRASGMITLAGASRESNSHAPRRTGQITVSGTLSDEYVGATVDRRSGTITLSGTLSDQYAPTRIDLRSGIIALTGTRRESWFWTATDKRTGTVTIDGDPGEIFIPSGVTTDKPTGTIVLSGSVLDIHSRWDWVDGERWPHDSDARWGNDVGERWEVDPVA